MEHRGRAASGARIVVLAMVLVLVLVMALTSCASTASGRWATTDDDQLAVLSAATSVPTAEVLSTAVLDVGPVIGGTTARTDLRGADVELVTAPADGQVEIRTVSAGDPVVAGDVLVELGGVPDRFEVLEAQILELERELAELRDDADELARIDAADVALRQAIAASDQPVVAPIDGVFSHHLVTSFVPVTAGDPVAAVAVGPGLVAVVPIGDDAESVGAGDQVTIRSRFEPATASVIGSVTEVIDGTATVTVPDDADLVIGDPVEITFSLPTDDALRAPVEAVRRSDRGAFVVVVTSDGDLERIAVEIGVQGDGVVQINDPLGRLRAGTTVVLP
ncbi:MAG: hypothetical protein AAGG08_02980 [Actinomycetota bacterium]